MKSQDDAIVLGGAANSITIDPSYYNLGATVGGLTSAAGYNGISYTTGITSPYTINTNNTYNAAKVVLDEKGIEIKAGADLVVGGKSLMKVLAGIEERLGILHPNPELEDRWDELKELREQYIAMEKDLLEKEKIMKILKES
jgi:hypothetical protein